MTIETKSAEFEVKSTADGSFEWEGYVAAYNNTDSYGDVIMPGAGAGNVGMKTYAMWEHYALAGALNVVREDNYGLLVRGKLMPDDAMPDNLKWLSNGLRWLANEGLQLKMSIGFYASDVSYDIPDEHKGANRIINKFKLAEGSIVLFPANEKAMVTGFKSLSVGDVATMTERDLEAALKSGQPVSGSVAKSIVAILKKGAAEIEEKRSPFKSLAAEIEKTARLIKETPSG